MAEGLSVFQVLTELGRNNYFLWEQLTASEQKQFQPIVLMTWMQGGGVDPNKLQEINLNLFNLSKQHQFLKLATVGKPTKQWKWVQKKAPSEGNGVDIEAIQYVYNLNARGAQQALPLFSESELAEIIEDYRDSIDSKETKKSKR